jgi:hypothetical protein
MATRKLTLELLQRLVTAMQTYVDPDTKLVLATHTRIQGDVHLDSPTGSDRRFFEEAVAALIELDAIQRLYIKGPEPQYSDRDPRLIPVFILRQSELDPELVNVLLHDSEVDRQVQALQAQRDQLQEQLRVANETIAALQGRHPDQGDGPHAANEATEQPPQD